MARLLILTVMLLALAACQPAPTPAAPTAAPPTTAAAPQAKPTLPAASVPTAAPAAAAQPTAGLSSEVQRLLAAAKANGENELNLSWGNTFGGSDGMKKFEPVFNKMYGTDIKVNFTPGPSMTDMAGRTVQEVAAGRKASSDILLGTESHFGTLIGQDALEEYDYTQLSARIPKEIVSGKNIGVEVGGIVGGIAYNPELVAKNEVPKTLEEVLNPKWKGKIASTQNAGIFDRVAARPEWTAEKMKDYVRRLSPFVGGLVRCNENERIISGEFVMMVLNCGSYQVRRDQAKGAPIAFVIPEDSATVGFFYMGVPKTSAHPNLAKLFINTMVSEEAQRVMYALEFTDHYGLPGSQSAVELTDLQARGIQLLKVDAKFVAERPDISTLAKELETLLRFETGSR